MKTKTRISCLLLAVGEVSLPFSRLTPMAAKSRLERSWSLSIRSLNSVPDWRFQRVSSVDLPPVFSGAGREMLWARHIPAPSNVAMTIKDNFFIFNEF